MHSYTGQQRIAAALRQISRAERGVTFGCFLLLIAVVFADVVSREISGTGLHWARQVGVYANVVVIMLGIGLASGVGEHLRPRFADQWLPAAWSSVLERLQDVGMALFCVGFAVAATDMVFTGIALDERSAVLGIVIWPFQAVLPLAFVVAAFRHAAYAWYPALRPVVAAPAGDDKGEQGC